MNINWIEHLSDAKIPWNFTSIVKIKDYFSDSKNFINWESVSRHLEKILKIYAQIQITEKSFLGEEDEKYLSFTLDELSLRMVTFQDFSTQTFREELIYQGIDQPTSEQINWLIKVWLKYVLEGHIKVIIFLIESYQNHQNLDGLIPMISNYIINQQADPLMNTRLLAFVVKVFKEKAKNMLHTIINRTTDYETITYAQELKIWLEGQVLE